MVKLISDVRHCASTNCVNSVSPGDKKRIFHFKDISDSSQVHTLLSSSFLSSTLRSQ